MLVARVEQINYIKRFSLSIPMCWYVTNELKVFTTN